MKLEISHFIFAGVSTSIAFMLAACPANIPADCSSLSSSEPSDAEVGLGVQATKSDGSTFSDTISWAPGPSTSIDSGTGGVSLIVARDVTGTDVADLVGRGAFPICVTLAARSDVSGSANINLNGKAYVSDDTHSGAALILGEKDGLLIGRFAVDVVSPDGSTESLQNGAFRAQRRE